LLKLVPVNFRNAPHKHFTSERSQQSRRKCSKLKLVQSLWQGLT